VTKERGIQELLVADPCHGMFYYRCIARCKKLRAIREGVLNEAVKRAVADVILKPDVILEPLRRLDMAEAHEAKQKKETAGDIEQEEKRLAAEEERILEA
jgi:hypothetical protein